MEVGARDPRIIVITGALAFGFFLLAYFARDIAPTTLAAEKAMIFQGILTSICSSFVFLFVLNVSRLFLDTREKRIFRAFFGDLTESSQAVFVYPDFELTVPAAEALANLTGPTYRKRSTHYPGNRFIDMPRVVASNDLLAIVLMATRLGKLLGDSPRILDDGQACVDPTKSIMSFGLTSNAITDLYLKTDLEPLFRIEDNVVDPKIVLVRNGEEVKYRRRDDVEQYGIILRYRPDPMHYPMTYWFICGGLTAAGTPAAAWNLSHNWRQYHERFADEDFVVILKTSSDILSYVNSREVDSVNRPSVTRYDAGRTASG
jgi:hypothetical protein